MTGRRHFLNSWLMLSACGATRSPFSKRCVANGSACRTFTCINQSREVAAALVGLGVQQGDRVAIIAENSIEWVCAYYGIVLAGGVGVPVYYDLQPVEVEDAVGRSGAEVAFVSVKALKKSATSLPGVRRAHCDR